MTEEEENKIAQAVTDKLSPTIVYIGGKAFFVTVAERSGDFATTLSVEPIPNKEEFDVISKVRYL